MVSTSCGITTSPLEASAREPFRLALDALQPVPAGSKADLALSGIQKNAGPGSRAGMTIAALLYYVTRCAMFPALNGGEEADVNHGIVDVFAFQEALLIEGVFGIALLAMIWVGFRRWLQHKERMGRLIAEQTAERAVQHGAQMERVEARLKAVEQVVGDGGVQTAAQIDAVGTNSLPEAKLKEDEV
jgi:hypothetical protein